MQGIIDSQAGASGTSSRERRRTALRELGVALGFLVWGGFAWAGPGAQGHAHSQGPLGIGEPGKAAQIKRTITIEANDQMRFVPDRIEVARGETVRLVVRNTGKLPHELVMGQPKELADHAEQMKKFPHMEHDEPHQVSVRPGQEREIVWRFTRAGTVHFACLHPGHFDAGMKGQVVVRLPR